MVLSYFKMKPRGTILKRIRFSSKNIIVSGVKYKIKAMEDQFDLLCMRVSSFLPTTLSEYQEGVPADWIRCGHVSQDGPIRFYLTWRNVELGHGNCVSSL